MTHGTRSFPAVVLCRPWRYPMLSLASLLIISIPISVSVSAQDIQGSTSSFDRLHGTVINSVTREPIARALVSSDDNRFAAFTDDQGRFEFQLPRAESNPIAPGGVHTSFGGPAQFNARKPGFLQSVNSASSLLRSAAADDITIALIPEALIVGRVNLPSSNQFDRITVEVYGRVVRDGRPYWGAVATASTRSNGEFRVANLSAGTYKIFTDELNDRDPITFDPRSQQYGYPPIYYPAASDFASAAPIALEAGKTFQVELSPVLQPYYPVKISIPNVQAGALQSLSVALQGHKGPGYSLGYTDEGIQGMLPDGIYTVEATLNLGQQTATGSVNITVRGAPLTHASVTVIPDGSIPVSIRDESVNRNRSFTVMRTGSFSREERANVTLQAADDFDPTGPVYLRSPRKPNDNDLALENVRPGRYWVNIDPHVGYVASAAAGSIDLLHQPLVVGPGGTSLPIEIVLRDDGGTIEGTVEGMPAVSSIPGDMPSARPVAVREAAHVYFIPQPDSPGRFTESYASPDGTFRMQQLPPGAYRVLAFDRQQGELEYRNPEAMSVYDDKGPVVRLAPGQNEQVRVPLISSKE